MIELGLRLVGRQIPTVAGRIGLLGRDPQGRWTIIEIKRNQTTRDALAQAIDYASVIAGLSKDELAKSIASHPARVFLPASPATEHDEESDEREIRIVLVGVGSDDGLQRIVDFLATRFQLPITVVSFSVFQVPGAGRVLVRELEATEGAPSSKLTTLPSIEDHLKSSASGAFGASFHRLVDAADKLGLKRRPFKYSVMFSPSSNGTRALFTLWLTPDTAGKLTMWLGTEVFESFYNKPVDLVTKFLGPGEWRSLTPAELDQFTAGLENLLESSDSEEL